MKLSGHLSYLKQSTLTCNAQTVEVGDFVECTLPTMMIIGGTSSRSV
jgi:hypothetical protein